MPFSLKKRFWIPALLVGAFLATALFFLRPILNTSRLPDKPAVNEFLLTADRQYLQELTAQLDEFKKTHPQTRLKVGEVTDLEFGAAYVGLRSDHPFKETKKLTDEEFCLLAQQNNPAFKSVTPSQADVLRLYFVGEPSPLKSITLPLLYDLTTGVPQGLQAAYAPGKKLAPAVRFIPDPYVGCQYTKELPGAVALIKKMTHFKPQNSTWIAMQEGPIRLPLRICKSTPLTPDLELFLQGLEKPGVLEKLREEETSYPY